jgi:hypothetical protein
LSDILPLNQAPTREAYCSCVSTRQRCDEALVQECWCRWAQGHLKKRKLILPPATMSILAPLPAGMLLGMRPDRVGPWPIQGPARTEYFVLGSTDVKHSSQTNNDWWIVPASVEPAGTKFTSVSTRTWRLGKYVNAPWV